ncbi:MAG: toll/interleukin-1 receptor domain-containing protein [Brevundimonas sp.]|uniref:toll/interleukin-1 receptor domain-containing protein n=1 Tax=Brevundimonas sp. TaxID=1871086 RepID=UPI00273653FD|nr:toll/interleukin-1 receptor domain-containing protein [Brevundimonas sp.]MDP3657794.1 toll/interleukin-1 receptor domain-containing protein [Brevundimonas sp.]MDZ4112971.1 toll/interleukin-1 receptor domain-containing protein [Brevundimonas sp.]
MAVTEHAEITAFLSYAHADFATDPALITDVAEALEARVNARLFRTKFRIWRDKTNLRIGDTWELELEQAVRSADILIILLSPKWLESNNCKLELSTFSDRDKQFEHILPIVVRTLGEQIQQLDDDTKKIYDRIAKLQYYKVLAPDFRRRSRNQKLSVIERLADDVMGPVERLQLSKRGVGAALSPMPQGQVAETEGRAKNFEDVDLISSAEVAIDPPKEGGSRPVSAQVSFVEHLYIQSHAARFEFGVRRAYVSIWSDDPESLRPTETIRASSKFVALHDRPGAISLCLEPQAGRSTLADLTLPVVGNENYFSHVGDLDNEVGIARVHATVRVSLSSEGLQILGEQRETSRALRQKLEAIMNAAVSKAGLARGATTLHRTIEVRERRS